MISVFSRPAGAAIEGNYFSVSAFQTEGKTVLTSTKTPGYEHDCESLQRLQRPCSIIRQGMNILSGAEYRRNYNVKDLPYRVRPQMHCWYQERLDVSDILPNDVPGTDGGTGKMLNTDGSPVEG
jgi:hypothetical protein